MVCCRPTPCWSKRCSVLVRSGHCPSFRATASVWAAGSPAFMADAFISMCFGNGLGNSPSGCVVGAIDTRALDVDAVLARVFAE